VRRIKAHHGSEDPLSRIRLADEFAVGSTESLFTGCVEQTTRN